ncbi:mitochondrial transcription rescue factor 1 [Spea bombifrons]|uniref:mitochondrial transcription rescue factor 1 n=1 Tax=Spea bombifrons TaxID=233779 RepID=UPI00234AC544|nr:mitochondrial transcription rescue factor 1 [Spea bombifrons]
MTGARLSLCAFRNLQVYARLSPKHVFNCGTCWTHYRLVSNTLEHHRIPITFQIPTNSSSILAQQSGNIFINSVRLKSKKSQKGSKSSLQEDDDEEEDPEDVSDYEDEPVEDPNIPKDYKDLEKAVQSFRYDVILSAGLDISRNKVEEAFYNNLLRLNGEKLWKKSRAVKIGDALDLILEQNKETETTTVMRVILRSVSDEKTGTEKYKVTLRRWKHLKLTTQDMPK